MGGKPSGLGVEVFSMGQVAALCNVAPRTAAKWFDSGKLRGYRIPGCLDRRVRRADLVRFMRQYGFPLKGLSDDGLARVLLVAADGPLAALLAAALEGPGLAVRLAPGAFEAGLFAAASPPEAVVLDCAGGRADAAALAGSFRRHETLCSARLVALANEDEADPEALARCGFDRVLKRPLDAGAVAAEIRKLLEGAP